MVKSLGLNFSAASIFHCHLFHKSSCCHQSAKFFAASTFHFHFSTHHLAAHHPALLPGHGMPPWDLLPPSAAPLRRRPLGIVFSIPPISLPNLLHHWNKLWHTRLLENLTWNIFISFLVDSISDSIYSIFSSWQSSLWINLSPAHMELNTASHKYNSELDKVVPKNLYTNLYKYQ